MEGVVELGLGHPAGALQGEQLCRVAAVGEPELHVPGLLARTVTIQVRGCQRVAGRQQVGPPTGSAAPRLVATPVRR